MTALGWERGVVATLFFMESEMAERSMGATEGGLGSDRGTLAADRGLAERG